MNQTIVSSDFSPIFCCGCGWLEFLIPTTTTCHGNNLSLCQLHHILIHYWGKELVCLPMNIGWMVTFSTFSFVSFVTKYAIRMCLPYLSWNYNNTSQSLGCLGPCTRQGARKTINTAITGTNLLGDEEFQKKLWFSNDLKTIFIHSESFTKHGRYW